MEPVKMRNYNKVHIVIEAFDTDNDSIKNYDEPEIEEQDEHRLSLNIQDFNLLQTSKNKIRSKSLPQDLDDSKPKNGELSQNTKCSLSLSAIYERIHNRHSVLEESFLRGSGDIVRNRADKASAASSAGSI